MSDVEKQFYCHLCFTVYISLVESVAFRYRELLEVYEDAYCTVFRYGYGQLTKRVSTVI
jgi:hypothetical protein